VRLGVVLAVPWVPLGVLCAESRCRPNLAVQGSALELGLAAPAWLFRALLWALDLQRQPGCSGLCSEPWSCSVSLAVQGSALSPGLAASAWLFRALLWALVLQR